MAGLLACAVMAGAVVWGLRAGPVRGKPQQSIVSGRAGLRTTSTGAKEHWPAGSMTITIDPTLARATPTARDAIISAFGAWASSGAALPQLAFDASGARGEAVQDGVNRLLLGPITVSGHEQDLAITISYAETETGTVVEADTIFNDAYDWTAVDPAREGKDDGKSDCHERYDLQNVATHEAGHFFGLGEDYDDPSTTMFVSSRPCQTSKRVLSPPDLSVVSGLYAQNQGQTTPHGACAATVARGADLDGAALAALAVVALALTRRRRGVGQPSSDR